MIVLDEKIILKEIEKCESIIASIDIPQDQEDSDIIRENEYIIYLLEKILSSSVNYEDKKFTKEELIAMNCYFILNLNAKLCKIYPSIITEITDLHKQWLNENNFGDFDDIKTIKQ